MSRAGGPTARPGAPALGLGLSQLFFLIWSLSSSVAKSDLRERCYTPALSVLRAKWAVTRSGAQRGRTGGRSPEPRALALGLVSPLHPRRRQDEGVLGLHAHSHTWIGLLSPALCRQTPLLQMRRGHACPARGNGTARRTSGRRPLRVGCRREASGPVPGLSAEGGHSTPTPGSHGLPQAPQVTGTAPQ